MISFLRSNAPGYSLSLIVLSDLPYPKDCVGKLEDPHSSRKLPVVRSSKDRMKLSETRRSPVSLPSFPFARTAVLFISSLLPSGVRLYFGYKAIALLYLCLEAGSHL